MVGFGSESNCARRGSTAVFTCGRSLHTCAHSQPLFMSTKHALCVLSLLESCQPPHEYLFKSKASLSAGMLNAPEQLIQVARVVSCSTSFEHLYSYYVFLYCEFFQCHEGMQASHSPLPSGMGHHMSLA